MIEQVLSSEYEIEVLPEVFGCWFYKLVTPRYSFANFVLETLNKQSVFHLTIRGDYKINCVKAFFEFLRQNEPIVCQTEVIKKLNGFHCENYPFNSAIVLGSHGHDVHKHLNKELHSKTLVVFPIVHCEFSGFETEDQIIAMRKSLISTLDWSRQITPKVLMRYNNLKTGSKSIGKKFGLANVETLYREIKDLTEMDGSFVEIQNYNGMSCGVTMRNKKYLLDFRVDQKSQSQLLNSDEIIKQIDSFLRD